METHRFLKLYSASMLSGVVSSCLEADLELKPSLFLPSQVCGVAGVSSPKVESHNKTWPIIYYVGRKYVGFVQATVSEFYCSTGFDSGRNIGVFFKLIEK